MDTQFYLGGALAFVLALVSWGDQIRGAQEKTRRLESDFLRKYKFRWADLQPLVRPDYAGTPAQRLASVLRILKTGGLTQNIDVQLLSNLERLNEIRNRLEPRYSFRFWLVFAMAVEMFLAGVLSFVYSGRIEIPLNRIWAGGLMILISAVLYQTLRLNLDEEKLRQAIVRVDDQLREAEPAPSKDDR